MPKIKIEWKKFDRQFPKVISEEHYNNVKYKGNPIQEVNLNFLKILKWEIFLVVVGVISVLILANNLVRIDSIGEIIFAVLALVAVFPAITLIISLISFIGDYMIFKEELKKLKAAVRKSNSYTEFCSIMAETSKSYVMHLARLKNEDKFVQ
jgi:hypothetical protein